MPRTIVTLALGFLWAELGIAAERVTILHPDRLATADALVSGSELRVKVAELERSNGFVLKPEGACREDLCIPIPQRGKQSLVETRGGERWLDLTGFARRVGQVFVADAANRVWSFTEIPALGAAQLDSAVAPDFALIDRKGRTFRLSELRGKKVLLVTWASW